MKNFQKIPEKFNEIFLTHILDGFCSLVFPIFQPFELSVIHTDQTVENLSFFFEVSSTLSINTFQVKRKIGLAPSAQTISPSPCS